MRVEWIYAHANANASQHIIHQDVVDVSFPDEITDENDNRVMFCLLCLLLCAFAKSFMSDLLCSLLNLIGQLVGVLVHDTVVGRCAEAWQLVT